MSVKNICIITDRYPTHDYPVNTFLDQLVCQFADMGINCTVIAPYSPILDKLKKKKYNPKRGWTKITKKGSYINVICPRIFYITGKKVGFFNFAELYQRRFTTAVIKEIKKSEIDYDVIYSHFIFPSGLAAAKVGEVLKKPVFIAYGESSIKNATSRFTPSSISSRLRSVTGIVAVSSKNRKELIENRIVDSELIRVFPNAIDSSTFYKMDKAETRKQLGINNDAFIVAFVGSFIHRKGSLRLSDAIQKLQGVNSFFIGSGEFEPTCDGILFSGRLPHNEIAMYLNAADVFVLPTLAEGCCNAIVEAMACGLPVISSNLSFNFDILDETNSIMVNPNDIDEISSAIETLKANCEMRKRLSEGALNRADELRIEKRAEAIINYIEEKIVNE